MVFSACQSSTVIDVFEPVPPQGWAHDSLVSIDVHITEANLQNTLWLNLRHTSEYEFANFHARLMHKSPSGHTDTIVVEVPLATVDGRWLGKGVGTLYSLQHMISTSFIFADTGMYQFYIQQHMRDNPIEGIQDIGIRIAPTTNP